MKLKTLIWILLIILLGCKEDGIDPLTIEVDRATNVILTDATNNGNPIDLSVSFTKAVNETNIAEYRVIIIKSGITLTLEEAESLDLNRYVSVIPDGFNQDVMLTSGLLDSDGDSIEEGNSYKAHVLSVADGINAGINALSLASTEVDFLSAIGEIEKLVDSEMAAWNINALAIAMIDNGEVIYAKGFGTMQLATQKPMVPEGLFAASSIAKLLVGVAVMQQVEKGTIDLDADVETYLGYPFRNPNFPGEVITPRLLLTHQSSLSNPTAAEIPELAFVHLDTTINLSDWIFDYLVPDGANYNPNAWKNFSPNTIHSSSNAGVSVLAHLVEKVTGTDFRDYAEEHIFTPLGMTNTSYRMSSPGNYDEGLLVDIITSTGDVFPNYMESPVYPAGMLRTSVVEWSKFFQAILNKGILNGNRILQESSVDEMLENKYPNAGLAYNSGIGLMWRWIGAWTGHTSGGFVTHSADLNMLEGKAAIIMCNGRQAFTVSPDPQQGKIYQAIHQYLLGL